MTAIVGEQAQYILIIIPTHDKPIISFLNNGFFECQINNLLFISWQVKNTAHSMSVLRATFCNEYGYIKIIKKKVLLNSIKSTI